MPPNLKYGREVDMLNAHMGSIRVMKASYDNQILVTAGKDGSIFIFRASEADNKNVGMWTKKKLEMKEKLEREEKDK